MGASRAAGAAAFLLEHYQPRVIISAGFGGTVTPELPRRAWSWGRLSGGMSRRPANFRAWRRLPLQFPWPMCWTGSRGRAGRRLGSVVTTAGIIHKLSQGGPLRGLGHPVLDLETSVLADYARDRGLPFLAVRAVTDAAGEEIPAFIRQAAGAGQTPAWATVLVWAARDPRRLAVLISLWRRSRLAGQALALAMEVIVEML